MSVRFEERRKSGVVLVVDDDSLVRSVTTRMLDRYGFRTMGAAGGQEGVELFRDHVSKVQAVLLDWSMPGMSGPEACREMRKLDPEVPVILQTGWSHSETLSLAGDLEPIEFLQKPYDPQRLIDILDTLSAGRLEDTKFRSEQC